MNPLPRLCLVSVSMLLASASPGLAAAASPALGAVSDARVGFQAAGPAGMKIEGTTADLKVAGDETSVVLTVPLSNLSTGISLRDEHMKGKYLETAKYPNATLRIARGDLRFPASGGKAETDAPGVLELHGKSNPVTVHYDASADGAVFTVHGRFHIRMTDFDIAVPTYLGVTVKPEVDVTASFKVARSGP
jgi:polyisoprenoid-binding protein YceI